MKKYLSLMFYSCLALIVFTFLAITFDIKIALVCLLFVTYLFYRFQNKPTAVMSLFIDKITKLFPYRLLFNKSKKYNKKNINKKNSFINIRKLFCNKSFYIFIVMFLSLNILLYVITYTNQKSLALNQQTFESNIDIVNVIPTTILSNAFDVEPSSLTHGYAIYSFLFLGLMLGVEIYILISIIYIRKHHPKRYLLFYFLILQPLVITPAFIATYVSEHVVYNLTKLAKVDVAKQVSLLSNSDSLKQLSIVSSPIEIKDRITQSSTPPKIIDEQVDSQAIIQSLQIEDKDTFYRVVIIPKYLLTQENLVINFDAYLFPNNVLVIKKGTKNLLSNILPVLSSKIVDTEMGKLLVDKKEPIFSVLSDDAYNLVQTQKVEERKAELLNNINDLKLSLADANYYIPLYETDIKFLENEKANYINRTDNALKNCEADFSIEDCKQWRDLVSSNIASYNDDIKLNNEGLQTWLYLKPRVSSSLQLATAFYEKFLKFPITPEFQAGVFNPPSNIYLKHYSEGDLIPPPSDYVLVGLHEYLHYLAYKPLGFLPSFLDEGLTDYLANKSIKKYSSNQDVTFHYPEEVFIVKELIKNIPEDKLISAYFNQSEKEFEKLFDTYYLRGTYKKFTSMGEDLTYLDSSDSNGRELAKTEIVQFLASNKKEQ